MECTTLRCPWPRVERTRSGVTRPWRTGELLAPALAALLLAGCAGTSFEYEAAPVAGPVPSHAPLRAETPLGVADTPGADVDVRAHAAESPPARARSEEGEGDEEELERNSVGLFLGGTWKDDESSGSYGLKYVRRLTRLAGVGLIFENSPNLEERIITVPGLFLYPWRSLSITLAPGVEFEDGEGSFLFRAGAGWDFELGQGFSLAPEVNFDFAHGRADAVVLGLTLGYAF